MPAARPAHRARARAIAALALLVAAAALPVAASPPSASRGVAPVPPGRVRLTVRIGSRCTEATAPLRARRTSLFRR